ncbi:hypothetical protein, partial [Ellagibacter isourolithinifaciens]|uniref:hypothetical protein n=1 Tax=Ellagibacter isourolithinifaciens TaxID=2137581 RepID=UPI003AB4A9A9
MDDASPGLTHISASFVHGEPFFKKKAMQAIASRFVVYQGPSPEPPATLARRMLPLLAPWVNRRRDYPVGGLPRRK